MAKKQPKVTYKLDLVKIFNRAFAGTELQKKNVLRGFISEPSVKLNYGRSVIDKIKERTQSGIDKNDEPFEEYSESYKESDKFEIFGKSEGDVNLTMSGEMLASMIPVAKTFGREITIEFTPDQNNKAHGHVKGSNILPKRDFFGLPPDEEAALMKRIVTDAAANNLIGIAEEFLGGFTLDASVGDQSITAGGV
jgi:hypothetical protein